MRTRIPTALISRTCVRTDRESSRVCGLQARWFVVLGKGDDEYPVCDTHADEIAPFERGPDWVEYARNERK